jgi:hypothetical protein
MTSFATLNHLLRSRGMDARRIVAIRNTLHPDDICESFRTIDDVVNAGALPMLDRMQDGPLIEPDTLALSFVALPNGRAKLTSFRRFLMRRQGVVPGDIVYDYEAAHLLHSFIARAATPVFYDAIDEVGLDDLIGSLVIAWPEPITQHIRDAGDPMLEVIAAETVLATSG